jgi:hypothetical protein
LFHRLIDWQQTFRCGLILFTPSKYNEDTISIVAVVGASESRPRQSTVQAASPRQYLSAVFLRNGIHECMCADATHRYIKAKVPHSCYSTGSQAFLLSKVGELRHQPNLGAYFCERRRPVDNEILEPKRRRINQRKRRRINQPTNAPDEPIDFSTDEGSDESADNAANKSA